MASSYRTSATTPSIPQELSKESKVVLKSVSMLSKQAKNESRRFKLWIEKGAKSELSQNKME